MKRELAAAVRLVRARWAAERQYRRVPGLSGALVHDQELLWSGGFGRGDLDRGTPAGASTVYRMASVTKLFTATAIMLLRDEGRLDLDDPIAQHVPALRIRSRFDDGRGPTLRQAASHTAGLPREAPFDYWDTFDIPAIDEMLASLDRTEMALAGATEHKYSNLGYALLGHVVERVSGQPFARFVGERILAPLGMADSAFDSTLSDALRARVAEGYVVREEKDPEPAPHLEERAMNPAGGLYSTVDDMARFAMLQLRDGPAGGAQILAGTTLREMRAPVHIFPDWRRAQGVGWAIERLGDHTAVGHSGGIPGYATNVALIPALGLGAIVFCNTGTDPAALTRMALELLAPVVARGRARAEARAAPKLPRALERYTGRYDARYFSIEVKAVKGRLALVFPNSPPGGEITLTQLDGPLFRAKDGELVQAELDDAGRPTTIRTAGGVYRRA
ncbi:MAG TPA: serine hydrolase, partial [Solirubrobacteraceae bacterium]